MQLPLRYQFILAPLVIVILLAGLIAYTLVELAHIRRQNHATQQWEVLTDQIQTAMTVSARLQRTLAGLSTNSTAQQEDELFNYLELSGIVADSLLDPYMLEQLPVDLRTRIIATAKRLQQQESWKDPQTLTSLSELQPSLDYHYKLFSAQRRTAYVDYHRNLVIIIPRLSIVLLGGLGLCIALAIGLGFWGLHRLRKRLSELTQRANTVCSGNTSALLATRSSHDELNELEHCLANMTQRLLEGVTLEKVLHGAEKERRRIAMEMHDGVLADLTTLQRKLHTLTPQTTDPSAVHALSMNIDDVIKSLRRTIDDLHPATLEILGIAAALRSFLDRHCQSGGLTKYHFDCDASLEQFLTNEQKLNLFRIVTEAVHNVIRHAHADRLEVSLHIVAHKLIVTIEDNGVGIPEQIHASGHGCANIRERSRMLGATVTWRASRFSSGICVELILPLMDSP